MREQDFTVVLWSSCLAMLAVGVNSTAITAALPTIRSDLSLSAEGVQWAVNAYLVVSAVCIVPGGHAADRFGARPAAIAGMALLAAATCLIAVAGAQTELLFGRALQGLAAALAVPSTLAALGTDAPVARRAAAIGAWTGFLMLGFSIGPLFGGALTHFAGWRMIFWLNVPLILASIVGLAAAGRKNMFPQTAHHERIDGLGFLLSAAFMVALVFALQSAPHMATAPLLAIGLFAGAVAALFLLIVVESRVQTPLVDVGFFRRRGFVTGVAIASVSLFSTMSLLLYFNLYAQSKEGLGLDAVEAGLLLLPLSMALLALALSASAVAARLGPRNAMTLGMALLAVGAGMVAAAIAAGAMVVLVIGFAVMGAGLALPYALAPRLALAALSPEQTGQGSGIVNACTFLSGSCGVACGAIAFASLGFVAVLAMIGAAAVAGLVLSRCVPAGS